MSKGELGKSYADREVICAEGDDGSDMFIIQSGTVRITKKKDSGDVEIASLRDGDIFGEMALFERQPRSATATALGQARVLSVDKKKIFQLIDRDPTLVLKILESMSQRIRALDEEITRLKKE